MAKQSFMPRIDNDRQLWLQNFANKLPNYATKYGVADADVTDMQNSSASFSYWLDYKNQFGDFIKKVTQFKNELKNGVTSGGSASAVPVPPTFAAAPTAVAPGIFSRASIIAAGIKNKANYSDGDGKDLGIEGTEMPTPDLANAKPVISVRVSNGGHPEIVWTKGQFDGIDIYVCRDNTLWNFLATDTHPNYTDTAPLPATGQSALWQYKAIYRYDDEQVGQWSNVVTFTVAGTV